MHMGVQGAADMPG